MNLNKLYKLHSEENIAELLSITLKELQIKSKLLTITADNANNNKTLISKLYFNLTEKFLTFETTSLETKQLHFQNINNYIRCLAHILNLIISDILTTLKAGDHQTAFTTYNLIQENKDIKPHSTIARLRIITL